MQNSALGTLKSKLKANPNVIIIDRFFPSTKMCPECGTIKEDITLSDRTFVCYSCGYTEDRDIKAAKTMLLAGRHEMSCTLAECKCTPEERISDFDTSYEIWKHSAKRPEMGKRPEAPSSSVSEDGVIHYVEGENAVIPREAIRDYFQLLPELKKFNSSMIDESEIEGRFDPVLGYYVLPADDEDEGYYDI